MDKTAIEKIVELGAPNLIEEYGRVYSDKPLSVVQQARKNVAEYLKNALSDLITDGTVIVVE